jgi:hypothetical protein
MISIGEYVIQADKLKVEPESVHRHALINALMCYYLNEQKAKFLVDKKKKNECLTASKPIGYNKIDGKN